MSVRVLMAAGGTGGHVMPALAVARLLKERDPACSCVAVTGTRGVAHELWDASVGELKTVGVEPWPRRSQIMDPRYWWRQGRAAVELLHLLRVYRPTVVVGFGGYVAGPAVLLGKLTGSTTVIHEQNVYPGKTTRMLVPWADRVAVSFEETRAHLPRNARVTVTGNPVQVGIDPSSREEVLRTLGLAPRKPVLLVMGGSQGSRTINQVCVEAMTRLAPAQRRTFQILHLTGPSDEAWVAERYRALGISGQVRAFLSAMESAYAVATLAVARAGATTVAELVATAIPSVLIPYPYASAHQSANAYWLSRRGGTLVIDQGILTAERFVNTVLSLLTTPKQLDDMRRALGQLAVPGAAGRLADAVLETATHAG